ncbi:MULTISPECIES: NAD regulator [Rhodomicrobium]|uniref:NUDIX hydrolase n=1 Tax=Rhodomicrobium TaxID=1068 RepID=UPI000B4B1696|nr:MULTISPECIES: NAD regulator [Rhodomicrobium]
MPLNGEVAVEIGLTAAIVSVDGDNPRILVMRSGDPGQERRAALPFGLFAPLDHRTLEIGLRAWVKDQTGLELGYVEQLYTFADRGRHARAGDVGMQVVSIGYLALTGSGAIRGLKHGDWQSWYHYFPWEDWRAEKPAILTDEMLPRLGAWAESPEPDDAPLRPLTRGERLGICFGGELGWDEEKVLDRYELLYEAGLAQESLTDGREAARQWQNLPPFGLPMQFDHRRILATAMSRLRGKIKYRPVIFELMPESFTLFELQRTVEAILGTHLHKQNFRRLIAASGLVEATGDVRTATGGRPAKAYRFRRDVVLERPSAGVRVRGGRG